MVISRASQLYTSSSAETPPIPRRFIPVVHPVRVHRIGNEFGVTGAGLGLGRIKPFGPEFLQRLCSVIQVLFQDTEVTALMSTLANEGRLTKGRSDIKLLKRCVQCINPLRADVQLF
jgi:hypothetical protein